MLELSRHDWSELESFLYVGDFPSVLKRVKQIQTSTEANSFINYFIHNVEKNGKVSPSAIPCAELLLSVLQECSNEGRSAILCVLFEISGYQLFYNDDITGLENDTLDLVLEIRRVLKQGISQYFYYLELGSEKEQILACDLLTLCARDEPRLRKRLGWWINELLQRSPSLKLQENLEESLQNLNENQIDLSELNACQISER